jgi:hypothetical protein
MRNDILTDLWVRLRHQVPLLVVRALDGHEGSRSILVFIRRNLDPTIEVLWLHLPGLKSEDLFRTPVYEGNAYEYVGRLLRLWYTANRQSQLPRDRH